MATACAPKELQAHHGYHSRGQVNSRVLYGFDDGAPIRSDPETD